MTGAIFDIKEFAVFDGPGIRTTVFMKGCPLRCRWCHNPEGLSPGPQLMVSKAACVRCGACAEVCQHQDRCVACGRCVAACRGGYRRIVGAEWTAQQLAQRLNKDADVYSSSGGGVTFSGGEPLMQWPFVREVIGLLPGIHTAVETSGYAPDDVFAAAMDRCGLIMMDWKISDERAHLFWTGVPQEKILRHMHMLCEGDTPFIIRMPVIPGVNDFKEHFETVAGLARNAKRLIRVEILPYQRAAGAKYEMVGMKYDPGFDEDKKPETHCDVFDRSGIPYKLFR